jgi:peptidoglycan/LPS O-acetylase OafA/YrhL
MDPDRAGNSTRSRESGRYTTSQLPRTGRITGLDGIRALAIGLVLFSHRVIFDEFTYLRPIGINAGYAGVVVFFALSGFLITMLLLREELQTGRISLPLFYVRRALRLFPALWVYLFVVGAVCLAGALPHHPWYSLVSSLMYVRNLVGRGHETDHLWSLSIEEPFYLLWPLALIALPRRNLARFFLALGGLVTVTVWRICAARNGLASAGALYIRSTFGSTRHSSVVLSRWRWTWYRGPSAGRIRRDGAARRWQSQVWRAWRHGSG